MQKYGFLEKVREKIRIHKGRIFNNFFLRWLLVFIFYIYVRFVFFTSKVRIDKSAEGLEDILSQYKTVIFSVWHQDIILSNFAAKFLRKKGINHHFNALASKHNDGKIVADFIKILNKTNIIYGSTNNKKKTDKSIDISSFRGIFQTLKKPGQIFFITPDGPRGPAKKINGHVCDIAILSKTPIVTLSCQIDKKITLDSWDKFIIPLPFAKVKILLSSPMLFCEKSPENISILQRNMP